MEAMSSMKLWQPNISRRNNNSWLRLEVQHLHHAVLENFETWESVLYMPFHFSMVPGEERKFIRLLAKELAEVDWSTRSVKNWVTRLQRLFNKNFVVSLWG